VFPTTIQLPDNWGPEGITIGALPFAYFGSIVDGSILRVRLATGEGQVISQGPGTPSVGLKIDRLGRLFVAGGSGGNGRVVSTADGRILASISFTTGTSFVNDVVLTARAAYFTDSFNPTLYAVPLGRPGSVPTTFTPVPLKGDMPFTPGAFNANGISATPDGRSLIVVHSDSGHLFQVNPATGVTTLVDLAGENVADGDGILLRGNILYVVQNQLNTVAAIRMNRTGTAGRVITRVTDPRFDVPTTVAAFGNRLYLPNARFGANPPATTFTAVAIPRPA
jgi:sugar lactone lactonase YvrE